jgi:hypothetical protein
MAIIEVHGQCGNALQLAIKSAVDGDTIQVWGDPSLPYSNITNGSKVLTLIGMNGRENCIIDGGHIYDAETDTHTGNECVYSNNSFTIQSFTLTNGYSDYGGGVRNSVLKDCVITNCFASKNGGGVFRCTISDSIVENCTSVNTSGGVQEGTLTNCIIRYNTTLGYGGGVSSATVIDNCIIHNNTARQGGGVYNCSSVTNTIIRDNTAAPIATDSGNYSDGGGAYCYPDDGQYVFVNCLFTGNHSTRNGGASLQGTFHNCTFINNRSDTNIHGISRYNSSVTPIILNCAFHSDPSFGGKIVHDAKQFKNCVLNGTYTIHPDGEEANIKVVSDVMLHPCGYPKRSSPCIGAGNASYKKLSKDIVGMNIPTTPPAGCYVQGNNYIRLKGGGNYLNGTINSNTYASDIIYVFDTMPVVYDPIECISPTISQNVYTIKEVPPNNKPIIDASNHVNTDAALGVLDPTKYSVDGDCRCITYNLSYLPTATSGNYLVIWGFVLRGGHVHHTTELDSGGNTIHKGLCSGSAVAGAVLLRDCIIENNTATGDCGNGLISGVYWLMGDGLIIRNNTIDVGNYSSYGADNTTNTAVYTPCCGFISHCKMHSALIADNTINVNYTTPLFVNCNINGVTIWNNTYNFSADVQAEIDSLSTTSTPYRYWMLSGSTASSQIDLMFCNNIIEFPMIFYGWLRRLYVYNNFFTSEPRVITDTTKQFYVLHDPVFKDNIIGTDPGLNSEYRPVEGSICIGNGLREKASSFLDASFNPWTLPHPIGAMGATYTVEDKDLTIPYTPVTEGDLYVDCNVSNSGAGTSWDTAFKTINEAIKKANSLNKPCKIVVADGDHVISSSTDLRAAGMQIVSANGPTNCIVHGANNAIMFVLNYTTDALIEGFTFKLEDASRYFYNNDNNMYRSNKIVSKCLFTGDMNTNDAAKLNGMTVNDCIFYKLKLTSANEGNGVVVGSDLNRCKFYNIDICIRRGFYSYGKFVRNTTTDPQYCHVKDCEVKYCNCGQEGFFFRCGKFENIKVQYCNSVGPIFYNLAATEMYDLDFQYNITRGGGNHNSGSINLGSITRGNISNNCMVAVQAIYNNNQTTAGNKAWIIDCKFDNNHSHYSGGYTAINSLTGNSGYRNCEVSNNTCNNCAGIRGAVGYNIDIHDNISYSGGGANNIRLFDSKLHRNFSVVSSYAAGGTASDCHLYRCHVYDNEIIGYLLVSCSATDTLIENNITYNRPIVSSRGANLGLRGCIIRYNKCLEAVNGSITLPMWGVYSCLIHDNEIEASGGYSGVIIGNDYPNNEVMNCTIINNRAIGAANINGVQSNGWYNTTGSFPEDRYRVARLYNCIIRNNGKEGNIPRQIRVPYGWIIDSVCTTIPANDLNATDYNMLFNFTTSTAANSPGVKNIITDDPMLDDNFKPMKGSPCIGAGTYDGIVWDKDLSGKYYKDPPTLGCYEVYDTISSFPINLLPVGGGSGTQSKIDLIDNYIQDGLIMMLDGKYNVGRNMHADSLTASNPAFAASALINNCGRKIVPFSKP